MDRASLKQSIDEWTEFYKRAIGELIPRDRIPDLPGKSMAIALTGVRRSGKTYTAIQMSSTEPVHSVLYYNFEDPLFYSSPLVKHLDTLISVATEYQSGSITTLILDELQNIPGWERWLRKVIDQKRYRIIITGSSAKLLSSELATSLTGRCLEHTIWPLSFSELLRFKRAAPLNSAEYLSEIRSFLNYGALPEVALAQEPHLKTKILRQYLGDIVLKDIVNRHQLRSKRALDQIVTFYLTNISSLHSYTSVGRAFDITSDTVCEYTGYLVDTFLLAEVNRYHRNLKIQARDPRKIYTVDNGFRKAGARSAEDDTGKLLENIVYWELRRRQAEVTYFKGKQEVDFIVTQDYKPVNAIQVCASDMTNIETFNREVSGLMECLRTLKLSEGIIVTHEREEILKDGNKKISLIPAFKWLME